MDTQAIQIATDAIPYPDGVKDRDARYIALRERAEETRRLEGEWAVWLHQEHAGEFTAAQHELLFRKAWENGHSSGYMAIEDEYQDLVTFARGILAG